MQKKHLATCLFFAGIVGLYGIVSPAASAEPEDSAGSEVGSFQIMKATADKVWRLNKITGEISVCTLDGERLVCTSSTEAIRPPAVTYEEREAERKRLGEQRQAKDIEFLDRVLTAVRSLFQASQDRERAYEAPQQPTSPEQN